MGKIEFTGLKFTGRLLHLNKTFDLATNIMEILHASATYGYKNIWTTNFSEMTKRILTVYCALEKNTRTQKYLKKKAYQNSDPSEKNYTSYVLGMTFCKLVASKELGFDKLLHYDMFANTSGFSITRNLSLNERPDFISYDSKSNTYLVIEAKGRSGQFDSKANFDGKNQTNSILSINGIIPLKVVTQSYFDSELKIYCEDPEELEGVKVNFNIDVERTYIESIKSIFKTSENDLKEVKIMNTIFFGQKIKGTPYFVGILKDLLFEENTKFSTVFDSVKHLKDQFNNKNLFLGSEGVVIIGKEILDKVYLD